MKKDLILTLNDYIKLYFLIKIKVISNKKHIF